MQYTIMIIRVVNMMMTFTSEWQRFLVGFLTKGFS